MRLQPDGTRQGPNNYFASAHPSSSATSFTSASGAARRGRPEQVQLLLSAWTSPEGDVSPKNFDARAAVNKDSALVWAFGGMLIDPPPAKERKVAFGFTISTAAIHDGLIYIPEVTGYLHCLDTKTGQRSWDHDFKSAVWGPRFMWTARSTSARGRQDRRFAAGKNRKVLATVNVEEAVTTTPSSPTVVLYVTTKSKLFAIAAK